MHRFFALKWNDDYNNKEADSSVLASGRVSVGEEGPETLAHAAIRHISFLSEHRLNSLAYICPAHFDSCLSEQDGGADVFLNALSI